jgi:AraC-like DNA-binding protein
MLRKKMLPYPCTQRTGDRDCHGGSTCRPSLQYGHRRSCRSRESEPNAQRLSSSQEALTWKLPRESKRLQRTNRSLEEAPVRTLNSRVSLARRNDGNAAVLAGGMPYDEAPPHRLTPTLLDDRVRKILEMVESGTFTMRDLALEFRLSPSYLQRLFKHETGISMSAWLSEQRLRKAAHLLANSYMSVKEIAHSIGYEHASSFIRAFERRFTEAPQRYRKQGGRAKC